jgi:hypothetical protein
MLLSKAFGSVSMNWLLLIVLLALFSGILALLLIPISLGFDSTRKEICVGWLGFSLKKDLATLWAKKREKRPEKRKGRIFPAVGRILWKDKSLSMALVQPVSRSVIELIRSISIRELRATLSTPDPVWNGMLWGVLTNFRFKNIRVEANFENINHIEGRFLIHPHRVVSAAVSFVLRLPHRRIIHAALHMK